MDDIRAKNSNRKADNHIEQAGSQQTTHGARNAPLLHTVDDRSDESEA